MIFSNQFYIFFMVAPTWTVFLQYTYGKVMRDGTFPKVRDTASTVFCLSAKLAKNFLGFEEIVLEGNVFSLICGF